MNLRQAIANQRIMYKKPLAVSVAKLKELNVTPESDIRIYPDYPYGWHATVAANERIYILRFMFGEFKLEIEPFFGFRSNGSLRRLADDGRVT